MQQDLHEFCGDLMATYFSHRKLISDENGVVQSAIKIWKNVINLEIAGIKK